MSDHATQTATGWAVSPRLGGVAGLLFVLIGAIELALAGGPNPVPTSPAAELEAYLTSAADVGGLVGALSGLAGAALLVFALGLRRILPDEDSGRLVWGAAVVMLAIAWMAQAAQQVAFHADVTDTAPLGALVGFGFLFAVTAGGVMATAAGISAFRTGTPPRWLRALGLVVLVVELVFVALPEASGPAFPVFLVWLVATSAWMLTRS